MSEAPRFGLVSVRPRTFCERTGDLPEDPEAPLTALYEFRFLAKLDEEARLLQIGVYLKVHVVDEDATEPPPEDTPAHVEAEVLCQYEFADLAPLRVDGAVQMPRQLFAHLIGMTISTARGVVVARAKHTVFQRAPLPIVSPIDFVDQIVAQHELKWVAPAVAPAAEGA